MLLQQLLFARLELPGDEVYLHADGSYMGYKFCGNLTGAEAAAGQIVTVQGHTVRSGSGSVRRWFLLRAPPLAVDWERGLCLRETHSGATVQAKLKPGKCSPAMMQGFPYSMQKPRDFHTHPDGLTVHWDGKVWCP